MTASRRRAKWNWIPERIILSMVDENGVPLRYSSAQRNFENRLCTYRRVLTKEKIKHSIDAMESELSDTLTG